MLYLEDFYAGDVLTDSIHPVKQMKFVCKQAEKDIPVFVPCIIRDEKIEQFKWWWGGDWKSIPDNGVYDTGIAEDFKFTEFLTTFYAFNFSDSAFGGFESETPNHQKNGAYGIIPKGGHYWKEGKQYISDRLIIHFKNETKPMTLEEAIQHCREKSCGTSACNLEHQQLAEWLEELQQYRKNAEKKQKLTEIKVVYPNNPKRKEIGFYYNKKEVSWEDILLVDRMHDYPYYFRDGMDYYPFMPDTNLG